MLQRAGLDPPSIDYYNAHGTSTILNDQVETRVLKEVFGDAARRLPISSIKGALGHSLGAASAIEAAVSVRALRDQVIPPTINYLPDPELDLDYVPNQAQRRPTRSRPDRIVWIRWHQQRPDPQENPSMTPAMTKSALLAQVVNVIRKAARVPAGLPITGDSRLVEDLAIDSLDLVGLILQLQDDFDVAIEEDAVPNLCRVADLAAYLTERRESAGS